MSRWEVTKEVEDKYVGIIGKFLNEVDSKTPEDIEAAKDGSFVLPLSDTELNPFTLQKILERNFGFEEDCRDDNGWQMDFWIDLHRDTEGLTKRVCISGEGITFALDLEVNMD